MGSNRTQIVVRKAGAVRIARIVFSVAVAALAFATVVFAFGGSDRLGVLDADLGEGRSGGAEELQEQEENTDERLEALARARREGTLGVIARIRRAPAPGWAGERIVNQTGDDWEPAIATDPNDPYVYILHNRFGGEPACPSNCPDPAMILHVS
ncbi:MAG: hypothetical protein ACRDHC_01510, partial [Actinomycetota bacterium]